MPGLGEVARNLAFARDNSQRAVVQIPVDGALQAHSWDVPSGRVVTATDGDTRRPLITPDGQWLWWFDAKDFLWWRSPFGSSPRGRREQPLRLRTSAGIDVALGADGTAIVSRPGPGPAHTLSLLPVGRVRPGTEPTFLGSFPDVQAMGRTVDDALFFVDTGTEIHVASAYTGHTIGSEETGGRWRGAGFTADGAMLLIEQTGREEPLTRALLWNPRTALRRELPLEVPGALPHRLTLTYRGLGAIIEARTNSEEPRNVLFSLNFDGAPPVALGPTFGTIMPGTAIGGPLGEAYAIWQSPQCPARMVSITEAEARFSTLDSDAGTSPPPRALHRLYRPAVGGYGD